MVLSRHGVGILLTGVDFKIAKREERVFCVSLVLNEAVDRLQSHLDLPYVPTLPIETGYHMS
jgi:hypothetical protein